MIASDYALNECDLLTVVDKMCNMAFGCYYFEYDNKLMLNSYVESGYKATIINGIINTRLICFLAHIIMF